MPSNIRILILEDNQNDADLLNRQLKKSGLSFTPEIVQTRVGFEHALQHFNPDLILADYSLPSFDAVTAFRIKQNKFPHIPFIIVSGVIGEEKAVELIKNGITDYAPKNKLFTLSSKINRALKDTEEKKEKIIIAEKLKIQAAALIIANKELLLQNEEKENRAADLIILSEALKAQKEEFMKKLSFYSDRKKN
jgi:DNA-binding NtrC family response regulator